MRRLLAVALLAACSAPPQSEPAPRATPPAAPLPPPPPAPAPAASPTCAEAPVRAPVCTGSCAPERRFTRTYGTERAFAPGVALARADAAGNLFVAGTTGRGPTSLGGKLLYTGWPRGVGEAFIAKYDASGAHVFSRQLFEATPAERKRGGRSSIWALALGQNGVVHGLTSRVGVEQAGTHLVTLDAAGVAVEETWVRRGLPTLVQLAEVGGTLSALGVRDDDGPALELAEHRIEKNGGIYYERRGSVPRPPGILSMTESHRHPSGVLWTATRVADDAGRPHVGGHSTCPLYDAEIKKDGSLVRTSSTPRPESCSWHTTELLAVLVGPDGSPVWQRSFTVPGYAASADATAVDSAGNTYFTGPFTGTAQFGDRTECAMPLPQGYAVDYVGSVAWDARCKCLADYADVFVLKLDAAGNPAWVTRIGDVMEDRAGPLVIDSGGNVIVAVGSTPLPDFGVALRKRPQPRWNVYAFSPSGAFLWSYPVEGPSPPVLASGPSNIVYVVEVVDSPPAMRITALQTPG